METAAPSRPIRCAGADALCCVSTRRVGRSSEGCRECPDSGSAAACDRVSAR
jgi:hypothetical protein